MSVSNLEGLFKNICCLRPPIKTIEQLKRYPNRQELISFLVDRLKLFIKDIDSTDYWDSDFEYGISKSCRILGELKAAKACEPMIELMDKYKEDYLADIHNSIMIAMEGIGRPALEPAYKKYKADKEFPESSSIWMWILANLGVKDPRIKRALLEHMETDPDEAVLLMGDYGDRYFLPIVEGYVKNIAKYLNFNHINPFSAIRFDDPLVDSYINNRESLVILKEGIDPNHPDFDEKVEDLDRKLLHYADFSIYEEAAEKSRRKIGCNEPCPCGSGKKYKKCCGSSG